jgi:ATP-binding cassette subfamily B (MDR/TAP) protein 1
MGMVLFIMFCSYALALWYGGRLVLQDAQNYSGGTVLIVFFSVLIGAFGLGQAMPNLSSLVDARVAGGAIFEVIDRSPIIDAESEGRELDDMRGELALEDVSFSYPSRPDASIFSKFSLTVPAGATVALVGQSGSGKSTVIQLVDRFYDPLAGSVLFATSIRENILYGKPDASEEEIVAAAKAANAHGFISKLPAGYATLCGERGTQMSGGQKQRIAIARAIVKDPKVLLLDEATSALDAESERVVQEALDRLMEGRTTIVVAHRLSTVRNADTIAVVEKGRVAERGSYADLMAKRGAFAALVKLQQRA